MKLVYHYWRKEWIRVPGSEQDGRGVPHRDPYDSRTWGNGCGRGFVSNARFASPQSITPVIERTNRNTTRAWRRSAA